VRNTGWQIEIEVCFDGLLLLLDVAPQYLLKGIEARSNIHFIMPILVTEAPDGGISSTDTVTRSLTSPTPSHPSIDYDPRLK